ncbi:LysR family transcriptional regulator [Dyella silvatica]|uniref:LysR family transcriptional regulator n=1 Tax=Dyella silvatica TaxID=2992128 RepID=UPI00224E9320|nr:LysR family transcriptional regulator [Dyella silvatica]
MGFTSERLSGVEAFVQAVDAGNFALAAERLRLTRSAVGKSIARLEQRLGTRLFHRTTRRQSLTEAGQAYYERCVRALAELEAAEAVLDSGQREPSGRLRVSMPMLFGRHCVVPVLQRLAQQYPRLELDLSFNDRVVDLVDEGFDLGIRIGPLADSASLAARRLGIQHMGIGAAPSYLAKHGWPSNVEEMAGHSGILYSRAGHTVPWRVHDRQGNLCDARIEIRLRLDDLQAIADVAVDGAGLAWLPCWLLSRYLQAGELALVMSHEHVQGSDIHAVWPHTRYLPSKTRAAIDALVREIPAMISRPLSDQSCSSTPAP